MRMVTQLQAAFQSTVNLYGEDGFKKITEARVCVIGLGGVGSWAVEALARTGVGAITLIDLDDVCVTNINRQIHATSQSIGKNKAELLKQRILDINPECNVRVIAKFFSEKTADQILSEPYSVVLDCIDGVSNKALLIAECVKRNIPLVVTGSGAERKDPYKIAVSDLSKTVYDRLLFFTRKKLRQMHSFPRNERKKFGVSCVYIPATQEELEAKTKRTKNTEIQKEERLTCNHGLGTAVFVTGSLGFFAAAEAIKKILHQE